MKDKLSQITTRIDDIEEKLHNKNFQFPADMVTGALFLLLSLIILILIPQQIKISEKDVVDGRAFPTLLAYVMIAGSSLLLVKEIYKIITKQEIQRKAINLLVEVKAVIIIAILVLTYLLAKWTDLFVVGAVFCSLAFLLFFRCKKKSYYAITLAFTITIWVIFRFVLGVDF